mgnify:CR=1 FL=1
MAFHLDLFECSNEDRCLMALATFNSQWPQLGSWLHAGTSYHGQGTWTSLVGDDWNKHDVKNWGKNEIFVSSITQFLTSLEKTMQVVYEGRKIHL